MFVAHNERSKKKTGSAADSMKSALLLDVLMTSGLAAHHLLKAHGELNGEPHALRPIHLAALPAQLRHRCREAGVAQDEVDHPMFLCCLVLPFPVHDYSRDQVQEGPGRSHSSPGRTASAGSTRAQNMDGSSGIHGFAQVLFVHHP